ncbi:MAG TPA: HPr family phosphocarrier protein [Xanthobacteraceae bacterium]
MSSSSGAEGGCPRQQLEDSVVRVLDIVNTRGLHARASAKFVQTVEKYDAQVRVTRGSETVGGTSIMGLMMLAAGPGTQIKIEACGPQAAEVMAALEQLVTSRFGEED